MMSIPHEKNIFAIKGGSPFLKIIWLVILSLLFGNSNSIVDCEICSGTWPENSKTCTFPELKLIVSGTSNGNIFSLIPNCCQTSFPL